MVWSGAVYHATRDSRVGIASSYCRKGYPYFRVPTETDSCTRGSTTSKHQDCKKYSKIPLCYPCIPKRAPSLCIPLGKPPYFDGEDYSMWSDKMRHHLTSVHESI
jgi:hypothetical protein